jgi:hypothetical protein
MRKLSLLVGAAVIALGAGACIPSPPPPPSPHRDVVVFGDSNAWGIGCSLGDAGDIPTDPPFPCTPQPDFSVRNETQGACSITGGLALLYDHPAVAPLCSDWASQWPGILDERTPKLVVLNTGGWEIVDRWLPFPSASGCSTSDAYNCPAPNLQWGNPADFNVAASRYTGQLTAAIDLFRSKGAKVLVLNSPYYAPQEPQVPGIADVWYEPYSASAPANWSAPNANVSYRSSKEKIDEFNAMLKATVDAKSATDPGVQFFDLWKHVSPQDANGVQGPSDAACPAPNETKYPPTGCPGEAIELRESFDHIHFTYDGYRLVIMPYVLNAIRQMLT